MFCPWEKIKNLITTVGAGPFNIRAEEAWAFVNPDINSSSQSLWSCEWGLRSRLIGFSFLTVAVGRQFNFLSSILHPGRLTSFFLFPCFPLQKCQHDFVSNKHFLCRDRYHLTPIYERHRKDTLLQHNMNILSSCGNVLYSATGNYTEGCGNLSRRHLNKTEAVFRELMKTLCCPWVCSRNNTDTTIRCRSQGNFNQIKKSIRV